MPKWHYMSGNKSVAMPANIVYVDTESQVVEQQPRIDWHGFRLGITCYARREGQKGDWVYDWQRWENSSELIEYFDSLCQSRNGLVVIASNPSFDLWILDAYRRLYDLGYRLKFFYNKGLSYILSAKRNKASIKFLAIQNFYPTSVRGLGDMLGFPKIDTNPLTADEEDVWIYCRRDVDILRLAFERWIEFLQVNDMGGFALTRAGQSMRAFRHRFMSHKILLHKHAGVAGLERESYFGGRTECFRLGEYKDGPYVILDVNSMYPFVMQSTPVPIRLRCYYKTGNLDWLRNIGETDCVCVRCDLDTQDPAYPVRINGKAVFPVGTFSAVLSTPAFRYALEHHHIKRIYECALYDGAIIFKDFVSYFYELRSKLKESGNRVMDTVCKLLLNSLYGKWGETRPVISDKGPAEDGQLKREYIVDYATRQSIIVTSLLGEKWTESGVEDGPNAFVGIASHITEAARLHLWKLITRLPRGRILYCDTDSLLLAQTDMGHFEDVLDKSRIGALGEDCIASCVTLYGLKDYILDGVATIKGISKSATRLDNSTFEQRMFPGIFGLMSMARPGLFPIKLVTKYLRRIYHKGNYNPENGIVESIVLHEEWNPAKRP